MMGHFEPQLFKEMSIYDGLYLFFLCLFCTFVILSWHYNSCLAFGDDVNRKFSQLAVS